MTYVIIPAYNEEDTIGPLVAAWLGNPRTSVVVIIDRDTRDGTALKLPKHGRLTVLRSQYHGKGQNIMLAMKQTRGREIILCDADITISRQSVYALMMPLGPKTGQRIVVPKPPTAKAWREAEAAAGVTFDRSSWPWVSGVRRIRTHLIPPVIYGYLTEVLINRAVNGSTTPYTQFSYDTQTLSPLRFTPERIQDLHAHGKYGRENGLL